MMSTRSSWGWLLAQLCLALVGMTALGLAPPVQGTMLLVSLKGEPAGMMARWAAHGDVRLVGLGPLRHSLLVTGDRASLASLAAGNASITLAGYAGACGTRSAS